jgi:hypothetical protein
VAKQSFRAFVIATLGVVAWFLSYRMQLRAKIPVDAQSKPKMRVMKTKKSRLVLAIAIGVTITAKTFASDEGDVRTTIQRVFGQLKSENTPLSMMACLHLRAGEFPKIVR